MMGRPLLDVFRYKSTDNHLPFRLVAKELHRWTWEAQPFFFFKIFELFVHASRAYEMMFDSIRIDYRAQVFERS